MFTMDYNLPRLVHEAAIKAASRSKSIDPARYWQQLAELDIPRLRGEYQNKHLPSTAYPAFPVTDNAVNTYATTVKPAKIIGIDGSQIYPDDALDMAWGYYQSIACSLDGQELFASEFVDIGGLFAEQIQKGDSSCLFRQGLSRAREWINERRDVQERELAFKISERKQDTLILLDGPLIPPTKNRKPIVPSWIGSFQGKLIVGLVSSPNVTVEQSEAES